MIPGDRALCSAPPPVVGGVDDTDVDWVARGLLSSNDGSIVVLTCLHLCRRWEEMGGGGREARGIPGRGEEDKYRGRKVQCRVVDKAQCGRDEEEGGSGGGWARDGVPGAGGELGRGG